MLISHGGIAFGAHHGAGHAGTAGELKMHDPHDDNAARVVSQPIELADPYAALQTLILDRSDVADFVACRRGGR